MWKKNFIWWKTSSFLGKIFNGKILRFFRQKWPLFWSKFLYFGYPENILGFRVLNVGFRVGFGYRPLGFGLGSGGLKCRVYPSGFRVFGSPDTSLMPCIKLLQKASHTRFCFQTGFSVLYDFTPSLAHLATKSKINIARGVVLYSWERKRDNNNLDFSIETSGGVLYTFIFESLTVVVFSSH